MASRSSSYRHSRRSSPQPPVASGSRSRNQERMETRHQRTRGRSRPRSPRHERWASNPPGGRHAPPMSSSRSRMSRTPPRMSRQRSSNYRHEDRHERGEGRRVARDRDNHSSTVRRRRVDRESENNWRTRARSSPTAETMRTRRRSRSLSPPGYYSRQERLEWEERDRQGGRQSYVHGGRRSQSSDASMGSRTPPFPREDDEPEFLGTERWGVAQNRASRDKDVRRGSHAQNRLVEAPWNDNPRFDPSHDDAYARRPAQNFGTMNNIGSAGNVFTGVNHGIINMTMGSTDEFMINLSTRLNICKRADHKYYAPDDEATLRRGQCTPGTHVNILHGITHWATPTSPDGEMVFWLSGQAGSGKTTIAYTIAHHFEALIGNAVLGASFFCSRQFPDTRSASSIIRTIVYHLALRSKPFQVALKEHGKFETVDHGPRSQMMGLLVMPWEQSAAERLANNEPCYVIPIDALDELEGTGGTAFLGTLFDVVDQQDLSGLKFFVTSRSDPALVRRIASFPDKQVCRLEEVPLEESNADIKLFLTESLTDCATTQQIQQLVADAAGLFIYAATVVGYVKGRDVEEQKSIVRRLLSTSSSPARRPSRAATATLDDLYIQILDTSLVDPRERGDPEAFQDCLSILHTFLCTIERTSTSVAIEVLNASVGNRNMLVDVGMAEGVLHRLYAVLYLQAGQVMFYHKSFADFLFDKGRSHKFFCDQGQHHRRLAKGCFSIMEKQLRFNIANIPTSYIMDLDNSTLPNSIETRVSAPLRYACGSWSAHLILTSEEAPDGLLETLDKFLHVQVLFWMETMNLLGKQMQCQNILRDAQLGWISESENSRGIVSKLADAAALAAYHSMSKAVLSTPHFYLSSLATFPRRSVAVQNWRRQFDGIPRYTSPQPEGVGREAQVSCMTVKSSVNALALSPGGVKVVVGSPDGLVRIWDLYTREEVHALKGHTDDVLAVAYSPDDTYVASGSSDQSVRVWDLLTGDGRVLQGHAGSVNAVACSPDGAHVVSGSNDTSVRVWNLSSGKEVRVLMGHSGWVRAVAYSPDGNCVVSGSDDTSVRVWDLSTGELARALSGHTSTVDSVAYSRDGSRVASGSFDKSVRVWDLSTGEAVRVLEGHNFRVLSVVFSPDGTHIVSGSGDSSVRAWDLSTGEARVLEGHTLNVSAVIYLPNGTHIVSGSADGSLRTWDLSAGEEVRVLQGHTNWVLAVAYSPDGTHVASGSANESVRVWDLSTGNVVRLLKGHTAHVVFVAYSPNGSNIVSSSMDRSVRVWEVSTGESIRVLRGYSFYGFAYSPHGNHVVSGSWDGSVQLWDLSTAEEARVLKRPTSGAYVARCSPDGTHTVYVSPDNLESIRVRDLFSGETVRVLRGHTDHVMVMAYAPDGTHLVSGSSDKSIRVWDVSAGEAMKVLRGHIGWVNTLAYSPDGAHVVSGSYDKSVRVWNLSTGEARVFKGHANQVESVAYSPQGTRVVSGSVDKSVRVWDVSPTHIPRYIREQGPDEEYTGWLLSPADSSTYLMFVQPEALLPDDSNILTLPATAVPHLDFSNAKLGERWAECYTPTSS